jgi:hypothetical protein
VAKGELEDFFHKAFSVNGFHLLVLSHSIHGICGYLCMCQVRVTSESILHYCRTEHHIPLNLTVWRMQGHSWAAGSNATVN